MAATIIAFSGIWNTWKTTTINRLKQELIKKIKEKNLNINVIVMDEVARKLFNLFEEWKYVEFQNEILKWEERNLDFLLKIKSNKFDNNIYLADRTIYEWYSYYIFNILFNDKFKEQLNYENSYALLKIFNIDTWETYKKIYDKIIVFTTPIKNTNKFDSVWYNNKKLKEIFNYYINTIKNKHWNLVKVYKNATEINIDELSNEILNYHLFKQ